MSNKAEIATKNPDKKSENPTVQRKADISPSVKLPSNDTLFLQRAIGNQAMQELLGAGVIQAKLKIGQPGDKYEQEADRVAKQVMSMPVTAIQHQTLEKDNELMQAKKMPDSTPEMSPTMESSINSMSSGGQPLPNNTRSFFESRFNRDFSQVSYAVRCKSKISQPNDLQEIEADRAADLVINSVNDELSIKSNISSSINPKLSENTVMAADKSDNITNLGSGHALDKTEKSFFESRFGYDFGRVRIHNNRAADHSAKAIQARAFTFGNNIALASGEYQPGTRSGQLLLAHELAHVVQQNKSSINIENSIIHKKNKNMVDDKDDIIKEQEMNRLFFKMHLANVKKGKEGKHDIWEGAQFRVTPSKTEFITFADGKYYISGEYSTDNIKTYDQEQWKAIDNWTPRYTHINGVWTPLEAGVQEARVLSKYLGNEPVLFTFNSTSGPAADILECLRDKREYYDVDTQAQADVIARAVENKEHIFVSAFSQGTIKTNNAVLRVIHAYVLMHLREINNPELASKLSDYFFIFTKRESLSDDELKIYNKIKEQATKEVQEYVHLFYSGNAVTFPVDFTDLTVAEKDFTSKFFGTYLRGKRKNERIPGRGLMVSHDFAVGTNLPVMADTFLKCAEILYRTSNSILMNYNIGAINSIKECLINLNSVVKHKIGILPNIIKTLKKIMKKLQDGTQSEGDSPSILSNEINILKELLIDIYVQFQNFEPMYSPEIADRIKESEEKINTD